MEIYLGRQEFTDFTLRIENLKIETNLLVSGTTQELTFAQKKQYYACIFEFLEILETLIQARKDDPNATIAFDRFNDSRNGILHGYHALSPVKYKAITYDLFEHRQWLRHHNQYARTLTAPNPHFDFTNCRHFNEFQAYGKYTDPHGNLGLQERLRHVIRYTNELNEYHDEQPMSSKDLAALKYSLLVVLEAYKGYMLVHQDAYSNGVLSQEVLIGITRNQNKRLNKNRNNLAHPTAQGLEQSDLSKYKKGITSKLNFLTNALKHYTDNNINHSINVSRVILSQRRLPS